MDDNDRRLIGLVFTVTYGGEWRMEGPITCECSNIHWPLIITETDTEAIPFHRLQTVRIGVLLTFSYYGLLHLIGKSQQFYPLHFLTTYLFYMLLSGVIIFYRRDVLMKDWSVLAFFGVCLIFCYAASRPEVNKYLKYTSKN